MTYSTIVYTSDNDEDENDASDHDNDDNDDNDDNCSTVRVFLGISSSTKGTKSDDTIIGSLWQQSQEADRF